MLLDTIQEDMYVRAKAVFVDCLKVITEWEDVVPALDSKCIAVQPWCEEACEDDIKKCSDRRYTFWCLQIWVNLTVMFLPTLNPKTNECRLLAQVPLQPDAIPCDEAQ